MVRRGQGGPGLRQSGPSHGGCCCSSQARRWRSSSPRCLVRQTGTTPSWSVLGNLKCCGLFCNPRSFNILVIKRKLIFHPKQKISLQMTIRCNVQCWDREKVRGNEMKNYLKKSILIHFQIELSSKSRSSDLLAKEGRDCTCDVVELLETNDGKGSATVAAHLAQGTTLTRRHNTGVLLTFGLS